MDFGARLPSRLRQRLGPAVRRQRHDDGRLVRVDVGDGGMPMPGGWTMSMVWMRMPGQTWPGAAASFLGMWAVMMTAMMLPSLVPVLWRYHQADSATGDLGRLTALVGLGYFVVWTMIGTAAFPLGVALAADRDAISGAGACRSVRWVASS